VPPQVMVAVAVLPEQTIVDMAAVVIVTGATTAEMIAETIAEMIAETIVDEMTVVAGETAKSAAAVA